MAWTACLEALRDEIPPNLYTLWIRPLDAEQNGSVLSLYAPNSYFVKHITEEYFDRIRELAYEYSKGEITDVQVKYDPRRDSLGFNKNKSSTIQDNVLDIPSDLPVNHEDSYNQSSFNVQPEQVRRTLNKGYIFSEFVAKTIIF